MTNTDAQLLIEVAKRLRSLQLPFPAPGGKEYYKADDLAKIRKFTIQAFKGKRGCSNHSFTLLYRKSTMLLRVDTDGVGAHYNTDGTTIPPHTPHVHIFNEKTNGHDALRLPESFRNPQDGMETLRNFFEHINIVDLENVQIVQQGGLPL